MDYVTFVAQHWGTFLATQNAFFHEQVDVGHLLEKIPGEFLTGFYPIACGVQSQHVCCTSRMDKSAKNSQGSALLHAAAASPKCYTRTLSKV